ncbi:MAG TPA: QueT transporter family protein [Methanoregulaceae archaeon]|nr:QueT transporter family protein [Methanoregulaceae archaeon]
MHELVRAWTERKGLALIAATALVNALVLIPFNQLQWVVAGIAIRPAAALPVVLGILFGPAAAWGLGIGNIAGDLFGSWSPMSIPGFVINVLYPYVSYLLWHRIMKGHEIRTDLYSIGSFLSVTIVSTLVCMALLALAGTLFFARPFEAKFISYFGNNIVFALTFGTAIYWLVLERAFHGGFVYGRKWDERKSG